MANKPSTNWQDYLPAPPAASPQASTTAPGAAQPAGMPGFVNPLGYGVLGVGALAAGKKMVYNPLKTFFSNRAANRAAPEVAQKVVPKAPSPFMSGLAGAAAIGGTAELARRGSNLIRDTVHGKRYGREVDAGRTEFVEKATGNNFLGDLVSHGLDLLPFLPNPGGGNLMQGQGLDKAFQGLGKNATGGTARNAAGRKILDEGIKTTREAYMNQVAGMGMDPSMSLDSFDQIVENIRAKEGLSAKTKVRMIKEMKTEGVASATAETNRRIQDQMAQAAREAGMMEAYGQYAGYYADQAQANAAAQASLMMGFSDNAMAQGRPDIADYYRYAAQSAMTNAAFANMNNTARAQATPYNMAHKDQLNRLIGAWRAATNSQNQGGGTNDFEQMLTEAGAPGSGGMGVATGNMIDPALLSGLDLPGNGSMEDLEYQSDLMGY